MVGVFAVAGAFSDRVEDHAPFQRGDGPVHPGLVGLHDRACGGGDSGRSAGYGFDHVFGGADDFAADTIGAELELDVEATAEFGFESAGGDRAGAVLGSDQAGGVQGTPFVFGVVDP